MFMFSIFCFIFAEHIKTRKTMIRLLIKFLLYGVAVAGINAQEALKKV